MSRKDQLLYLLTSFCRGDYSLPAFCSAFEDVFFPAPPQVEFSTQEFEQLSILAEMVSRYSPYTEDIKKYPNVYFDDDRVRTKIHEIAKMFTII